MTPLASLSIVSVFSMIAIVAIVLYLYIANPHDEIRHDGGSFYENWLQVRWGLLECLGTFIFTFVSQHTVHLAFDSLKPELRTIDNFKKISSASISICAILSLSVGGLVYASFWQATKSDIFEIYPNLPVLDLAKLLLCITMLLTFPLPFFACRELIIITFFPAHNSETPSVEDFTSALQEPLLEEGMEGGDDDVQAFTNDGASFGDHLESLMDVSVALSAHALNLMNSCLLPGEDRQLKLFYHMSLTIKLWFVVTGLAIAAPNLGDILNLVGCTSGTVIAFIFPACLAFRLEGYSYTALLILVVGGTVGVVGTYYSLKQLASDLF
jgi:amino acid permease